MNQQQEQNIFISVIVPVYNAEQWLHKCVGSLIAQTMFSNLEIILIDDGSTDKSADIIDAYSEKHENIRAYHVENGGVSKARNIGLDKSCGEYIAFVDADDYVSPDFVAKLYKGISNDCQICSSGFVVEYQKRSIKRCPDKEYLFNNEEGIHQYLISGVLDPNVTNKLFKKSVIESIRFCENIAIGEDRLFLYECIKQAENIRLIPITGYHYVMNDASACRKEFSPTKLDAVIVAERICEDIELLYPKYSDLAKTMVIDTKCRMYGEMYHEKAYRNYKDEYMALKSSIKAFSIKKKIANSNTKHLFAYLAARIHPGFYCFLKNEMKLQYR